MHKPNIYTIITTLIWWTAAMTGALAMTSCANDEPADASHVAMQVDASFGAESRATEPLDGSVYKVWSKALFTDDIQTSYYFTPETIALDYNAAKNSYLATGYYYPLYGKIDLIAYATNTSQTPNVLINTNSNGNKKTFYTFNVDLSASDGTNEVIYSDVSSVSCPVKGDYTAPLHFHRPYGALIFKFIPVDKNSCEQIVINKIEVPDVIWQGKITITYNDNGTPKTPAIHSLSAAAMKTIEFGQNEKMQWDTENDKAKPLVHNLYLLKKVAKRPQIIIYYTVHNGTIHPGGVNVNDDNVRHLRYIIPAEGNNGWELQTQYYYNITVHGNSEMDFNKVDVIKVEEGTTGTMHI